MKRIIHNIRKKLGLAGTDSQAQDKASQAVPPVPDKVEPPPYFTPPAIQIPKGTEGDMQAINATSFSLISNRKMIFGKYTRRGTIAASLRLQGLHGVVRELKIEVGCVHQFDELSRIIDAAGDLLMWGGRAAGQSMPADQFIDRYLALLSQVRGNRADELPMSLQEARRFLLLVVEEVHTHATKGVS